MDIQGEIAAPCKLEILETSFREMLVSVMRCLSNRPSLSKGTFFLRLFYIRFQNVILNSQLQQKLISRKCFDRFGVSKAQVRFNHSSWNPSKVRNLVNRVNV